MARDTTISLQGGFLMRSTIKFRVWRAFAELLGWILLSFFAGVFVAAVYAGLGGIDYPLGIAGLPALLLLPLGLVHAIARNIVITTTPSDS